MPSSQRPSGPLELVLAGPRTVARQGRRESRDTPLEFPGQGQVGERGEIEWERVVVVCRRLRAAAGSIGRGEIE